MEEKPAQGKELPRRTRGTVLTNFLCVVKEAEGEECQMCNKDQPGLQLV